MRIKEVMNKAVAINHDISLKEAAKIMSENNIGSLIAVKKDNILGIVTEKDIVDNIDKLGRKVSSLMERKIVTVNEGEDIENAAILMSKHKIKRLPVIDDDDRLVGIITTTDLIANSEDLNEEFMFD